MKFQKLEVVYVFTKCVTTEQESKQYKRLYVGETDNMETVIQNHEKLPCLEQYGVDSICVHLESDKKTRYQKANDLINRETRPPCNDE